jgi:hypothetical protein
MYKTKRSITVDDLQPLLGLKRVEAAKTLGVSVPTFKRYCRQNGITGWNGDGCSLVEPKLLNNSVHQISPGSKPPEVQGEKETSALSIAKQDMVTVKAKYGKYILKFKLPLESGVAELNEAVAKRVKLELGNFIVEYEDEEQVRVLIACDDDLHECVKFSSSLGNQVTRLLVTDKVSNSEKSLESF